MRDVLTRHKTLNALGNVAADTEHVDRSSSTMPLFGS